MSKELYTSIVEQGLDLNEYYFLVALVMGLGFEVPLTPESLRKLEKLNFYRNFELSDKAITFVTGSSSVAVGSDEGFDEFYNTFPVDDGWLPFFEKSRPIRCKRNEVKQAYVAAVAETPAKDILEGTRNYVKSFEPTTSMLKESPLKYMKGPLNFLRDKVYLKHV